MSSVDDSSPTQIKAAIDNIWANNSTVPGRAALSALFNAPNRTLSHDDLLTIAGGGLTWHFGWLCKRVAEKLGDSDPPPYALADRSQDKDGKQLLTLKACVVAAMEL
jgi:hypothetical protein